MAQSEKQRLKRKGKQHRRRPLAPPPPDNDLEPRRDSSGNFRAALGLASTTNNSAHDPTERLHLAQAGRLSTLELISFWNELVLAGDFPRGLVLTAAIQRQLPCLDLSVQGRRELSRALEIFQHRFEYLDHPAVADDTLPRTRLEPALHLLREAIPREIFSRAQATPGKAPRPSSGKTNQAKPRPLPPLTRQSRTTTPPATREPNPMADLERLFPAERDLTLLPNFLLDRPSFERCLNDPGGDRRELFDLAMQAHELSLLQTYDHLLCLSGLRGVQPLQYQEETVRKVLKDFRGRAILADEVGLGKTIEAGMVLKEYLLRRMIEHALILVPSSLVTQWREELDEKFGLVCSTSEDPEFRENPRSFWDRELIITSLHAAKSDLHLPLVTTRHFDLVIVDEAHHLKHNSTKNWKLVNALQKRYLLFLTATPVENNLLELYNLITLLKPGQLGTAAEFRAAFTTKGDLAQPRDSERLRGLLGTIMVRNTRAVVGVKLPPRIATTLRVPGTPEETARYEQVTTLVKATLAQGLKRMTAGTLLHEAGSSTAALRQGLRNLLAHGTLPATLSVEVNSILRRCEDEREDAKLQVLLALLSRERDKTVVFVNYRATLDEVSERLGRSGLAVEVFHGGLDQAAKHRAIDAFRGPGEVLVATDIGGEGHNLQFCHRLVNYDLPWNPMRLEQRIGRLHRFGQPHEVVVVNLCAAGSIEDYVLTILDKKINMFELVIGEMEMILGRLSGPAGFEDLVLTTWLVAANAAERANGFETLGETLVHLKQAYAKTKQLDETLFGKSYEL